MSDHAASLWGERVAALAEAFAAAHKELRKPSADPFETAARVKAVRQVLTGVEVNADKALDAVLTVLETECVRLEAEFWGLLTEACGSRGWDVFGSTNRRLVNKAVFVSLEGSVVKIEGALRPCTPFIPSVVTELAGAIKGVETSEAELKGFMVVLAKAYDSVPRAGLECSLEAVYRQCVFESQKPTFWRGPNAASFAAISRSAFRYRLSEILRLGLLTNDSRAVELGTTTMSKDAWEVYSPGEQRVVIAGRIKLTRAGGDSER